MVIGSKLPPLSVDKTYFNLGRAAFAFLMKEILQPVRVYLPSFTCWSLVTTVAERFPDIDLVFYDVDKTLKCHYPAVLDHGEVLVYIHYFGHENDHELPLKNGGVILEDISHALASRINHRGDYVFGSLRKTFKIADGGIILDHFLNPVYERSNNLDSWLRYQAADWRDMREAENMTDRHWAIRDISSQSLEVVLASDMDLIRQRRQQNEKYLFHHLKAGHPLLEFSDNEAPQVHNRLFESREERDMYRKKLAEHRIFTSIHWPAHPVVKEQRDAFQDAIYMEDHIVSIPVSQDYQQDDMEYIARIYNRI